MATFYSEHLKAATEKYEKKIQAVPEAAADLKPKDLKIEEKPDLKICLLTMTTFYMMATWKKEDKKFILELTEKTDFLTLVT